MKANVEEGWEESMCIKCETLYQDISTKMTVNQLMTGEIEDPCSKLTWSTNT